MNVTEEENREYGSFIREVARRMDSLNIPPDLVIWHYTDARGLLGILGSELLHATQVACVNDSSEVIYAQRHYRAAIEKLISTYTEDDAQKQFLRYVLSETEEIADLPSHAASQYFITCFSALRDDVNQWLKYGGDRGENGYAVGFRAQGLMGSSNTLLGKVNYDPVLHSDLAREVAKSTLLFFKKGIVGERADNVKEWSDIFFRRWDALISQLSPLAKDEGFSSEVEYRLIHQLQESEYANISFSQKTSLLARYLPLGGWPLGQDGNSRLPITEVIVGPGRHKEISKISVGTRLRQLGYTDVRVTLSSRPLQRP